MTVTQPRPAQTRWLLMQALAVNGPPSVSRWQPPGCACGCAGPACAGVAPAASARTASAAVSSMRRGDDEVLYMWLLSLGGTDGTRGARPSGTPGTLWPIDHGRTLWKACIDFCAYFEIVGRGDRDGGGVPAVRKRRSGHR